MPGRIFDGKEYRLISRHGKKRLANKRAKEWREAGSLARVVKEDGDWAVYRRAR